MVDTSMETQSQQVMEVTEALKDNLEIEVDSLNLGMSSHQMVSLREDLDGYQFTLSPVIVNNTQWFQGDIQNLLGVMVDISMEN